MEPLIHRRSHLASHRQLHTSVYRTHFPSPPSQTSIQTDALPASPHNIPKEPDPFSNVPSLIPCSTFSGVARARKCSRCKPSSASALPWIPWQMLGSFVRRPFSQVTFLPRAMAASICVCRFGKYGRVATRERMKPGAPWQNWMSPMSLSSTVGQLPSSFCEDIGVSIRF